MAKRIARPDFNYIALVSGIFAMLLGGGALFGWVFESLLLTRINADWKPMAPSTAHKQRCKSGNVPTLTCGW